MVIWGIAKLLMVELTSRATGLLESCCDARLLVRARKQFRGWASLLPPWPNPEGQGTPARMGATGEDSPVDARCQRASKGKSPKKPAKYSPWLGWAQFAPSA